MQDPPERPPVTLIRRSLRPPPLGHAWAWIIIAVSVVILTSITLWVVVSGKTVIEGLSGRDAVHQITEEWRERWSQIPGPPSVYSEQAATLVGEGSLDEAALRLSMALALDGNRAEDWVRMVCLSVVKPRPKHALSAGELRMLVPLLADDPVGRKSLRIVQEWEAHLQQDGVPFTSVRDCFGLNVLDNQAETGTETLDTLPAPP